MIGDNRYETLKWDPLRQHLSAYPIKGGGYNVYKDKGKQRFYTGGTDDSRGDYRYPGLSRGAVLSKIYSESTPDQPGFPRSTRNRNQPGGLLRLSADPPVPDR